VNGVWHGQRQSRPLRAIYKRHKTYPEGSLRRHKRFNENVIRRGQSAAQPWQAIDWQQRSQP